MPVRLAAASAANGAVFAVWPVMWIVVNALLVWANVAVASGRFDAFRIWIRHLPNDRRVVLVAVGFCFSAHCSKGSASAVPAAIAPLC